MIAFDRDVLRPTPKRIRSIESEAVKTHARRGHSR
jgi:hypothetical protein